MEREAGRHCFHTDLDMSHSKKRPVFKSAVIEKGKKPQGKQYKAEITKKYTVQ